MDVKPRSQGAYAAWRFELSTGVKTTYQTAPSLSDPIDDVVPFLVDLHLLMAGRDVVGWDEIKDLCVSTIPGMTGPHGPRETSPTPLAEGYDLADVFRVFWYGFVKELRGRSAAFTKLPPSYRWGVWYTHGGPLELSFQMVNPDGTTVPVFDVERTTPESLVETLRIPQVITSIPRL